VKFCTKRFRGNVTDVRRRVVFPGDLVDHGPAAPAALVLVMGMVPSGHAAANSNIGCGPVVSGV
jgi:hypothetical protein